MKVYIVFCDYYQNRHVSGVFLKEESAKAYVENEIKKHQFGWDYDEYEVEE